MCLKGEWGYKHKRVSYQLYIIIVINDYNNDEYFFFSTCFSIPLAADTDQHKV